MAALPHKQTVALDLLERASIFVHLDPRKPGVVVPAHLAGQPQLVLQIGLNMAVAIPDLDVAGDGIRCTLSFNRRPYQCVLPWSAVYALIGEPGTGGMVWPEDVPPEVVAQQSRAARARPRRPHLRAVEGGASRPADSAAAAATAAAPAPGAASESPPPEARESELPVAAESSGSSEGAGGLAPVEEAADASAEVAAEGGEALPVTAEPPTVRRQPVSSKRARPPYLRLVE